MLEVQYQRDGLGLLPTQCQGCRAPRSSGFVFPLPEDALGESLQFPLGFSAARRAHGAFGEDINGWQPAALSSAPSPQPQEREGAGSRRWDCQRRSRDFHAFCVHSFRAGSAFVLQNLLVTLSYRTLPFSFAGFAFFSLQAGFSGLVWGSPLPTLCSCSQLPWAVWMQQSSPQSRGCSASEHVLQDQWEVGEISAFPWMFRESQPAWPG